MTLNAVNADGSEINPPNKNRRGFLGAIIGLVSAGSAVRASRHEPTFMIGPLPAPYRYVAGIATMSVHTGDLVTVWVPQDIQTRMKGKR